MFPAVLAALLISDSVFVKINSLTINVLHHIEACQLNWLASIWWRTLFVNGLKRNICVEATWTLEACFNLGSFNDLFGALWIPLSSILGNLENLSLSVLFANTYETRLSSYITHYRLVYHFYCSWKYLWRFEGL